MKKAIVFFSPGLMACFIGFWVIADGFVPWEPSSVVLDNLYVEKKFEVVDDTALTERYDQQALRPLLNPSRRIEMTSSPQNDDFRQYELRGTFSSVGDSRGGVILFGRESFKSLRLKIGESIGAWRLESIDTTGASFVSGEILRELPLVRLPSLSGDAGGTPQRNMVPKVE